MGFRWSLVKVSETRKCVCLGRERWDGTRFPDRARSGRGAHWLTRMLLSMVAAACQCSSRQVAYVRWQRTMRRSAFYVGLKNGEVRTSLLAMRGSREMDSD